MCCSVLQRASCRSSSSFICWSVLQSVAECCRVLQSVAVCWLYSVSKCVAMCCSRPHADHPIRRSVAVCCSVLKCVAVCCSVLQCVAVCCSVSRTDLQAAQSVNESWYDASCLTLEHASTPQTHCNTLQLTATHCNTLQHTVTHCKTLQNTAPRCKVLQNTTPHCNTLQNTAPRCKVLQNTATHCNTLHHFDLTYEQAPNLPILESGRWLWGGFG